MKKNSLAVLLQMWQCPLCKEFYEGMAKARHQCNSYKDANDKSRCDQVKGVSAELLAGEVKCVTTDELSEELSEESEVSEESADWDNREECDKLPLVTAPARQTPAWEFTRRTRKKGPDERPYCMQDSMVLSEPRDMVAVFTWWRNFVRVTHERCSPQFWKFFLPLHEKNKATVDTALNAAKEVFMSHIKDTPFWHRFPGTSRRILQRRIDTRFWARVTHTVEIKLTQFRLPKPTAFLKFTFVDPIFAWIVAARRQPPKTLHFKPAPAYDASGDRMYGGGIQQGLCFEKACRSCPPGYPSCTYLLVNIMISVSCSLHISVCEYFVIRLMFAPVVKIHFLNINN